MFAYLRCFFLIAKATAAIIKLPTPPPRMGEGPACKVAALLEADEVSQGVRLNAERQFALSMPVWLARSNS